MAARVRMYDSVWRENLGGREVVGERESSFEKYNEYRSPKFCFPLT